MTPTQSSGLKSADAVINARPCYITAVTLIPAAADCSVILYDDAAGANGTVLAKVSLFTALAQGSQTVTFNQPIQALKGIYADVSGSGANYIVHFIAS